MSVRILQGDCLQVLKTLGDESVHCVVTSPLDADVVQFSCPHMQPGHLFAHVGRPWCAAHVSTTLSDAGYLAGLFDDAKRQAVFGLRLLDSQIREQSAQAFRRFPICYLPCNERPPTNRSGTIDEPIAAEYGMEQVNGFPFDLLNTDSLAECGLLAITDDAHLVGAALDADCPVCINNSCAICQRDFVGHRLSRVVLWQ